MNSTLLKDKIGVIAKTSVGMVRSNNEDFHGYSTNVFDKDDWHFYESSIISQSSEPIALVVADGMGGLEMGEEASRIAVTTTKDFVVENAKRLTGEKQALKNVFNELFERINHAILDFAKEQNKAGELGTTLIISLIYKNKVSVFWIGDSRCYLLRKGILKLISKDHSYVQELVDKGKLTYEQSFFHPDSNIITKYMGDIKNSPVPSFVEIEIEKGDVILMCTDGLNGMLQDHQIEAQFYGKDDLSVICDSLLTEANNAGGNDNTTIVMAAFDDFTKYIPETQNVVDPNSVLPIEVKTKETKSKLKKYLFLLLGIILGLLIMYFANEFLFKEKNVSPDESVSPSESIFDENTTPVIKDVKKMIEIDELRCF